VALFPQPFIDEVRNAADIVTVISDYVSLKKGGTSYKGLCPFHAEKSPSFHVHRDRGFFHCFGCGVGGDVFKFMELQEKVGFTDAVRQLAQRFGIPVPELDKTEAGRETAAEREALLKIHEIAAAYFREQLDSPSAARIRDYLLGPRALTTETITALNLGYAPSGSDGLRQRLLKHGFPPASVLRSGLVVRRDDGTEVDRFRNRLMIPIARDTGSVIAFGGRALERDQLPKYLNSPETPIYTKSRTLYGLHLSKGDLRKSGFAIIVEGYFDFAQVYQAGGLPVVATCGTALTIPQAVMLRRFASKAVLCFDPDTAGQSAAERSCELLVGEGFDVNVMLLPGAEDPDTYVQRHGREAYVRELRQSRPYLDFLLDRAAVGHDLGRDDARREFLQKMLAVAARIPDPATRDQFADRLAHKARVTEEVVRAEIRKAAGAKKTVLSLDRARSLSGPLRDVEKGLLWAMMHAPSDVIPVLGMLEDADFEGLRAQSVLQKARALQSVSAEEFPSALMERLTDDEAQLLSRVAIERERLQLVPENCVQTLRSTRIERELGEIQQRIDGMPASRDDDGVMNRLLRRKNDLRTQLDLAQRTAKRYV
jgi:DNA primase